MMALALDRLKQSTSMDVVDCRTHTYVAHHRSSPEGINKDSLKKTPARIFEHHRLPADNATGGPLIPSSKVKYPASFAEIKQWLDDIIVEATVNPPRDIADPCGCVKLLFLDEKECLEAFKVGDR